MNIRERLNALSINTGDLDVDVRTLLELAERRCDGCRFWDPPIDALEEEFGFCHRAAGEGAEPAAMKAECSEGPEFACLLTEDGFSCSEWLKK